MGISIKHSILCAIAGVLVASFAGRVNATLIDLGERDLAAPLPGVIQGISFIENDQGLPPGTLQYLNNYSNLPNDPGWKNDGNVDNTHFSATLIDNNDNALISWDLGTSGFQLSYVFLKDGREDPNTGPFLYHLYGVTPDSVFNSNGDQLVTINGLKNISFIAFFGVPGSPAVPEGGATIVLLGFALGGIEVLRRLRLRNRASA
jgi:hypothetical protein